MALPPPAAPESSARVAGKGSHSPLAARSPWLKRRLNPDPRAPRARSCRLCLRPVGPPTWVRPESPEFLPRRPPGPGSSWTGTQNWARRPLFRFFSGSSVRAPPALSSCARFAGSASRGPSGSGGGGSEPRRRGALVPSDPTAPGFDNDDLRRPRLSPLVPALTPGPDPRWSRSPTFPQLFHFPPTRRGVGSRGQRDPDDPWTTRERSRGSGEGGGAQGEEGEGRDGVEETGSDRERKDAGPS